jgi:hypothetical protein
MSSAAPPVEIIPGHRESHSGSERKLFAFPPESLFAFSQESCSSSPRNRFHVHPGIPFALPRNPQLWASGGPAVRQQFVELLDRKRPANPGWDANV